MKINVAPSALGATFLCGLGLRCWRVTEVLYICPVENGVIIEAATGKYMGGLLTGIEQLLGFQKALYGNVMAHGCAGGALE